MTTSRLLANRVARVSFLSRHQKRPRTTTEELLQDSAEVPQADFFRGFHPCTCKDRHNCSATPFLRCRRSLSSDGPPGIGSTTCADLHKDVHPRSTSIQGLPYILITDEETGQQASQHLQVKGSDLQQGRLFHPLENQQNTRSDQRGILYGNEPIIIEIAVENILIPARQHLISRHPTTLIGNHT